MRNRVNYILLLFCGLFSGTEMSAQGNGTIEDTMRSNDKIYVVMAVCISILAGLIFYLVTIDRKIAKIEDKT